MHKNRLNTAEETKELEDAREQVRSDFYKHIYDWVFACGHIRFETGKCDECKRRYWILQRAQKKQSLDAACAMLKSFGYSVTEPT